MRKKHTILLFSTLLLLGCKTDSQLKAECEALAEPLADEWLQNYVNDEQKQHISNLYTLVKENIRCTDGIIFSHEEGKENPAFNKQVAKDFKEVMKVGVENRYDKLKDLKFDSLLYMGFAKTEQGLGIGCNYYGGYPDTMEALIKETSILSNRDSLIAYLKSRIYKGEKPEAYQESVRSSYNGHLIYNLNKLSNWHYIGFAETEYYYPPIMLREKKEFEGGIICVKLKIFRTEDKSLIVDKRIFATNSSKLGSRFLYRFKVGRTEYGERKKSDLERLHTDLRSNLEYEIKLAAYNGGVPFSRKHN